MTGSRKAAMDAMCKACIYDPIGGPGTWRQQVEACTFQKCANYELRPLPHPTPSVGTAEERTSILASEKSENRTISAHRRWEP